MPILPLFEQVRSASAADTGKKYAYTPLESSIQASARGRKGCCHTYQPWLRLTRSLPTYYSHPWPARRVADLYGAGSDLAE
jgi:hypothetical protein